jgi:hypothetical protein
MIKPYIFNGELASLICNPRTYFLSDSFLYNKTVYKKLKVTPSASTSVHSYSVISGLKLCFTCF